MENRAPDLNNAEFELLVEASKQYEVYLQVTAAASTAARPEAMQPSHADWAHPMGLVTNCQL